MAKITTKKEELQIDNSRGIFDLIIAMHCSYADTSIQKIVDEYMNPEISFLSICIIVLRGRQKR